MAQQCVSQPRVKKVVPEIVMIGLVRHVAKVGLTGVLLRVPETENDKVYEQAVVKAVDNLPLWQFDGEYATRPFVQKSANITVVDVITALDDARFILTTEDGKLLTEGSGKRARLEFDRPSSGKIIVWFLNVVRTTTEGRTIVFRPEHPQRVVTIDSDQNSMPVVAEYIPANR
jgi:hypothetical protein